MSSSALGYFYSTSQTLNSAPSTLPRRSRPTNHHYLAGWNPPQVPLLPPYPFQQAPPATHHPVATKSTSTSTDVRRQQNQESQVDETMLGINHAPSSDPDSPALSASPPPAPAPRPPPVRNGCQRCRFNASVNSSLNRSHQHLTSSDSANNTLTRGSVHNSSLRGGGDGRNHIATSTGHLHTAGSTASNQVTVASTGHHAHNGTYPGGGKSNNAMHLST